jgi:ABC-type sugar transport system substrate-binding protein
MAETYSTLMLVPLARSRDRIATGANRWLSLAGLAVGVAGLVLLPGCDSMSFTPPRPAGLSSGPTEAAPVTTAAPSAAPAADVSTAAGSKTSSVSRTRLVELLVAQPPDLDRENLVLSLRRESGVNKCGFRFNGQNLKKPMTPAELAAAIRAAASRSTGALILEPIDAPEVRDALREAKGKGLPIVLLDTTIPDSSPGKFYPSVSMTGFTGAGKQVVEATIEDAGRLHLQADSPVLVLENRQKDRYSQERLEALVSALKAAGRRYEIVAHDGDQKSATDAALKYLHDHPKASIILADHENGVAGAYHAFIDVWKASQRNVVRGGFAACDGRLDDMIVQMTEAVANRNGEEYARKILALALNQMEGKTASERVEVPIRFIRNAPKTPPSPKRMPEEGKRQAPKP